jgi:hypothetical protein
MQQRHLLECGGSTPLLLAATRRDDPKWRRNAAHTT